MAVDDVTERVAGLAERLGRMARTRSFSGGLNPAQWDALRYLARCNRFSNSPGAVAQFLGSTKGTVSQTVTALVRKGMVDKRRRSDRPRSVELVLTERGRRMLASDPLADFEAAAVALGRDARGLADGLSAFIDELRSLDGAASFGTCRTCRFLEAAPDRPRRCHKIGIELGEEDMGGICVAHEAPPTAARSA
jgi:DNA-binding MarR family transcriptional regulator